MPTLTITWDKIYQIPTLFTKACIKKPLIFKPIKALAIYSTNWRGIFFGHLFRKVQNFCRVKLTRKERIKAKLVEKTRPQWNTPWNKNKKNKSTAAAEAPAKKNFTTDFRWLQIVYIFGQELWSQVLNFLYKLFIIGIARKIIIYNPSGNCLAFTKAFILTGAV